MAENKTSNRHLASWASVCNLFILLYRLLKASTMQVGLNVSIHSMKRTKISFSSGHSDQQVGGPYWACSHDGESLQNFVKDFFCNSDWAASVQPCSAAHDRTIWTSRRISRLARLVAALPLARRQCNSTASALRIKTAASLTLRGLSGSFKTRSIKPWRQRASPGLSIPTRAPRSSTLQDAWLVV